MLVPRERSAGAARCRRRRARASVLRRIRSIAAPWSRPCRRDWLHEGRHRLRLRAGERKRTRSDVARRDRVGAAAGAALGAGGSAQRRRRRRRWRSAARCRQRRRRQRRPRDPRRRPRRRQRTADRHACGRVARRTIASGDDELHGLGGDRLFARHFGMAPRVWAAQPAVRRVVCADDCTPAIADAVRSGARLLAVDGDVALAGPACSAASTIRSSSSRGRAHASRRHRGRRRRPCRFAGWSDVRPARVRPRRRRHRRRRAWQRGADIVATCRPRSALDASGSFVRVNGSWKDF